MVPRTWRRRPRGDNRQVLLHQRPRPAALLRAQAPRGMVEDRALLDGRRDRASGGARRAPGDRIGRGPGDHPQRRPAGPLGPRYQFLFHGRALERHVRIQGANGSQKGPGGRGRPHRTSGHGRGRRQPGPGMGRFRRAEPHRIQARRHVRGFPPDRRPGAAAPLAGQPDAAVYGIFTDRLRGRQETDRQHAEPRVPPSRHARARRRGRDRPPDGGRPGGRFRAADARILDDEAGACGRSLDAGG